VARNRHLINQYIYNSDVPLFIDVEGIPEFNEVLCGAIQKNISHAHLYPFVIQEVSKKMGFGVFADV
jgi:hypothetical protein